MLRHLLAVLISCLAFSAPPAQADVFRPAYLELREAGDDRYDVLWKVPGLRDGRRLAAHVRFPEGTHEVTSRRVVAGEGAWVERYRIERTGGLEGQTISIDGLIGGVTDVIARVERADGTSQVERLLPQEPHFTVDAPAGQGEIAWSYLVLGIDHILDGIDHLLFVAALLLIVRGPRRILATITAFTIAHSITLACATFGWLQVPGPPVEALIALSIMFVAAEVLRRRAGRGGLTGSAPWVVAFAFGLLHGLGFAGALAEVGLPHSAIPLALLMFNVGVEIGQLLFVAVLLGAAACLRSISRQGIEWATAPTAFAVGVISAYWFIERVASF